MDGPHTIPQDRERGRWRCLVPRTLGKPTAFLALCVIFFGLTRSLRSEDRSSLFNRPIFRSKTRPQPTAVVSPTVHPRIAATDSMIQPVGESTERIPVSNNMAQLKRFPQNSTGTAAKVSGPIDDFTSGLDDTATPIDLPAALQLAGLNSPEVLLAQQRVLAVTARQQLAAAQALPDLNIGTSFDSHTGALQTSSGLIEKVERSTLYVGAGGNAVGSGTVNLPGLQYNLNVGETYFEYLVSRQQSERSRAGATATRNNVLLQIAIAYCQLVRAQGTRAIAVQVREDAAEIARITAAFAKIGQGMPADAERAVTELGRRDADIFTSDALVIEASARLAQILNLESSVRLQSNENWIVPRSIVPDMIPLPELIVIALYQRPEVAERRAEVHAAMLQLDNAKLLLFSPQFIAGFSDGAFGGGSDVNSAATGNPRFGNFSDRTDLDIVLYWSIRNLGLANRALIKTSTARLAATDWERTKRLNEIRAEVADAYARTQTRAAQLDIRERAVSLSERGFREDLRRAHAGEGRPIEVLDSLRLRALAQQDYLDTIANYNQAQYELYVAIGQPPADLLIHTAPPTFPPSPDGGPK